MIGCSSSLIRMLVCLDAIKPSFCLLLSGFDRRAVIIGGAIKHRTGGALRLLG
jgi:hypothetical protein